MQVRLGLFTALSLPLLFAWPVRAQAVDPTVAAADAAFNAKQYASAIPLYKNVAASQLPDRVRARANWRIGYAYYYSGDKTNARTAWLGVAEKFPQFTRYACEALLRAGNVSAGTHDLAAAIDSYRRASDDLYALVPDAKEFSVQATCWLGNLCVQRADKSKALAADAISSGGGVPTASRVWDQAAADYAEAASAYARVVSGFPETALAPEAAMQLVALKYEYAINDRGTTFDQVVAAADSFLMTYPKARKQLAVVHQVRAEALYADGKYDEALKDLSAVQNDLGDVAGQALGTAQYFTARCYERMRQFDRAIAEFQRFLDEGKPSFVADSERAAARYAIATMLQLQGQSAEARAGYDQVIAENPGSSWETDARNALTTMSTEVLR